MSDNKLEIGHKWWIRYVIVPIISAILMGTGVAIFIHLQKEKEATLNNGDPRENGIEKNISDGSSIIILDDKSELRGSPQISASPVCRLFPSDQVRPLRRVENEGHTWCEVEVIKGRQCTAKKGFIYNLSIIYGDCSHSQS